MCLGGVGEEIASILLSNGVKLKEFKVFALPVRFIEHGERGELLGEYLDPEKGENR